MPTASHTKKLKIECLHQRPQDPKRVTHLAIEALPWLSFELASKPPRLLLLLDRGVLLRLPGQLGLVLHGHDALQQGLLLHGGQAVDLLLLLGGQAAHQLRHGCLPAGRGVRVQPAGQLQVASGWGAMHT